MGKQPLGKTRQTQTTMGDQENEQKGKLPLLYGVRKA
jgi:hypothetical protein